MRVLHVITALGVGGAEHMLLKLLGARALGGFEHSVIALLPGGALAEPLRVGGARVEELNLLGGLPVLTGTARLALSARRQAPDLVHGWMYHGNLGALIARAALRRRAPLVWGVRQSLPTLRGENAWARVAIHLNRRLSRKPDRLLFNSRVSLEQHLARGFDASRAMVLPNGFDTTRFKPDAAAGARLRAEWGATPDDLVFGLLARYHPVKDHAGFLQAAARVHRSRPRARFVLAGPGVDGANPRLAQTITDAGLGARVHLLGERRDVPAVLAALDVYVSSSRAEAFSNAVGEAMSCGLPCVVTAVGDSPAVVADSGRVVPPGDPAALADAMLAMAALGSEGRAALGAQARLRIETGFGLEAVAARHADLYRDLVAAGRGA
jgi:glycosyltransferase involved in cell wall biosynthesis